MHNDDLGTYLKSKREAAGLSQIDVSQTLGYSSPQFVSNWERGLAKPPSKSLAKLVKIYKLNSDELVNIYVLRTRKVLEKAFNIKRRKT